MKHGAKGSTWYAFSLLLEKQNRRSAGTGRLSEVTMALMIFQSSNFQVQFESTDFSPAELQIVQPRAAALPGTFETDFATLCGWFGIPVGKGFGPSNRVIVTLNKTIRGASNGGYNTNKPSITVDVNLGGTVDSVA